MRHPAVSNATCNTIAAGTLTALHKRAFTKNKELRKILRLRKTEKVNGKTNAKTEVKIAQRVNGEHKRLLQEKHTFHGNVHGPDGKTTTGCELGTEGVSLRKTQG
jgi:hypothetical protein